MRKRKLLVMAHASFHVHSANVFSDALIFLQDDFEISIFDPLSSMIESVSFAEYETHLKKSIDKVLNDADAFVAFSYGGVLLANYANNTLLQSKKGVFVSTPQIADTDIVGKLSKLITMLNLGGTQKALDQLEFWVTGGKEKQALTVNQEKLAFVNSRQILAFSHILSILARENLDIRHCHLVGEKSQLVNMHNTVEGPKRHVITNASMRILQDAKQQCQKMIKEVLND